MRGPCVPLGATATGLYHINPYKSTMIIARLLAKFTFPTIFFLLNTENWPIFILHREIYYSIQNNRKKMIGRHTRFRGNGDLPPWQGPAAKKKPPFSNVRALITRKNYVQ